MIIVLNGALTNNEVFSNCDGIPEAIMSLSANPSPGAPLRSAPPSPTTGEGTDDGEF
jgi:hypothetical protein